MDCATFQFVNLLYVFVLLIHNFFYVRLTFLHKRRFTLKDTLTLASQMTETNLNLEKKMFLMEKTVNENRGQSCSGSLIVFLSHFFLSFVEDFG